MRDTERDRNLGRGRSRLYAGSPMWDSIPKLGSCPEPKTDAQPLGHPGVPLWPSLSQLLDQERREGSDRPDPRQRLGCWKYRGEVVATQGKPWF